LGLDSRQGKIFFSFPHSPDRLEAHPASYPMGTGGSFSRAESGGGVKLTTHLHLVPRLRMVELYLHFLIYIHGVMLN
jgi:hypothetical protein